MKSEQLLSKDKYEEARVLFKGMSCWPISGKSNENLEEEGTLTIENEDQILKILEVIGFD
jgi:hypothetical protein